jgi:hypothetical protein
MTSIPEDPFISVHVRALGDWTTELYERARSGALTGGDRIAYVDGPYGTASEEIFSHTHAIMIGCGIGVTPFAAVLQSVQKRMNKDAGCMSANCTCSCACCMFKLQKLYFYWTTPTDVGFKWFGDMLRDLDTDDGLLEMNMYVTRGKPTDKERGNARLSAHLLGLTQRTVKSVMDVDVDSGVDKVRPRLCTVVAVTSFDDKKAPLQC